MLLLRRLAKQLAVKSDVIIENFKPGGLARFGLDPESVAERWPGLIHTSITGFGTAGGSHPPGYDLLVQGVSGFMSVTGSADARPGSDHQQPARRDHAAIH